MRGGGAGEAHAQVGNAEVVEVSLGNGERGGVFVVFREGWHGVLHVGGAAVKNGVSR